MLIMAKEIMEEKETDNKGETTSVKHAIFFKLSQECADICSVSYYYTL